MFFLRKIRTKYLMTYVILRVYCPVGEIWSTLINALITSCTLDDSAYR